MWDIFSHDSVILWCLFKYQGLVFLSIRGLFFEYQGLVFRGLFFEYQGLIFEYQGLVLGAFTLSIRGLFLKIDSQTA